MVDLSLEGVRVLDLTRLLPGGYASLLLADLGATVVKIEEPPLGDPMRHMPLFAAAENNVLFELVNRGKKSVTLNLKSAEGNEILRSLVRSADVLLEGFRPGVMRRLGLDYGALEPLNPRLVYASLSGYGQDGPYCRRAGHDMDYIAVSGLLDITGMPGGPPVSPGIPVADLSSALWTALAIVAALLGRQRTGHGQYLDISMLDGIVAQMAVPLAEWVATGNVPKRGTMPLSGGQACYGVYETADHRHMALAALEPKFWEQFCCAVRREEWVRRQTDVNQTGLTTEVAALFSTQTRTYWTALFAGEDCCCEPVLTLDEAFKHPQTVHRGLLQHGRLGTLLAGAAASGAPTLGEHTAQVLADLGYGPEQVKRMREEGVL